MSAEIIQFLPFKLNRRAEHEVAAIALGEYPPLADPDVWFPIDAPGLERRSRLLEAERAERAEREAGRVEMPADCPA